MRNEIEVINAAYIITCMGCEWTSIASGAAAAAAAGDHADAPVLGARLVMSSSNDDASPGGGVGGGGGGGDGSGTCKLVLLVRGAVVTQGIRDVTHG